MIGSSALAASNSISPHPDQVRRPSCRRLTAKAGLTSNDGAIKGVNLAKIAGAVASLAEGGVTNAGAISAAVAEARRPNEQTDFSKFLSAFVIESGVMQAREISLTGPFVTMAGGGSVNLAAQTIDLRLAPRATTTADGEGGRAVAVPVRIGGTFAEPTIGVDVETLVRGEAEELIRGVVGDVLGDEAASDNPEGVARELLRGVLGGEQTETNNSNDVRRRGTGRRGRRRGVRRCAHFSGSAARKKPKIRDG